MDNTRSIDSEIRPADRVVTFPSMGREYSLAIKNTLQSLGLRVIPPPDVTDKTIKIGVRHSADMMCFPYKTTLGNFVEALEMGANTLLMYNSCGQCRLKHYYKLHDMELKRMGYKFEFYPVKVQNIVSVFKKLSGKSTLTSFNAVRKLIKEMKRIDDRKYQWSSEKLNIGIIGEIYTCCEERVNYELEKKLKVMDVNPYNTARLSEFIYDSLHLNGFFNKDGKIKYKKEASQFLNGPLGGHGYENIYNLLWMIDKRVDGVIHLLPLSCMPEVTVEPIINNICRDSNIPLLRLLIDDANSEVNVGTRVETFIELIKRKKGVKNEMLARN